MVQRLSAAGRPDAPRFPVPLSGTRRVCSNGGRSRLHDLPLTVKTGEVAAATTRPATLPRNSLASPERPWVPMTITSARFDLAKRTICSCAIPSSKVPEVRTPAFFTCASSFASFFWAHVRLDVAISS